MFLNNYRKQSINYIDSTRQDVEGIRGMPEDLNSLREEYTKIITDSKDEKTEEELNLLKSKEETLTHKIEEINKRNQELDVVEKNINEYSEFVESTLHLLTYSEYYKHLQKKSKPAETNDNVDEKSNALKDLASTELKLIPFSLTLEPFIERFINNLPFDKNRFKSEKNVALNKLSSDKKHTYPDEYKSLRSHVYDFIVKYLPEFNNSKYINRLTFNIYKYINKYDLEDSYVILYLFISNMVLCDSLSPKRKETFVNAMRQILTNFK